MTLVSVKRVRRLMRLMGLRSVTRRPNGSRRTPDHVVSPYLLTEVRVTRSNRIWCADLSRLTMAHGYFYVVAIMDWHSRIVLAWCLSNR